MTEKIALVYDVICIDCKNLFGYSDQRNTNFVCKKCPKHPWFIHDVICVNCNNLFGYSDKKNISFVCKGCSDVE